MLKSIKNVEIETFGYLTSSWNCFDLLLIF